MANVVGSVKSGITRREGIRIKHKVHCSYCISCRQFSRANWLTGNAVGSREERRRYFKDFGNTPYGIRDEKSLDDSHYDYHFCVKCAIKLDIKGGDEYECIKDKYARFLEGPLGDDTLSCA